ncbi:EamA family transporter [Coleofasciculus sp. FACHB-64]|uniref:DMT family transporter n=1 Tax=Cyanophyceae TaxID=3028117 RepID=UPI0016895755|nr:MULTISPECIES: EamA family transporter [unclassified Coleofasciculus]MBD1841808.1 EamA family transporter [Coleofasciculus sp. FACHB-501]MBD2047711.1 EamA family transporter [Coleofasciculus sp. FACHB-64]
MPNDKREEGRTAPRPNRVGVALIAVSATGFATLAIFAKLAYAEGLDLPSTLAWRFTGAAAILWSWLVWRDEWRLKPQDAIASTLLGGVGYAIQATLFFGALAYTSAGVAALLLYTYPAFVTVLAWVIEGDRPGFYRKIALGLALTGCLLTADLGGTTVQPLGLGLGIASGAWYALYLTFGARLVRSLSPVTTSAYLSLGAALSFMGAACLGRGLIIPQTSIALGTIAGLAVIATVLPIVTLFAGIQRLGTSRAAILSTIEPVVTVLLGIVFLGEQLVGRQILGGLLVVSSVVLIQAFPQD